MRKDTIAVGMIGSTARAALWIALGALTLGAAVATRQALAQDPADEQATVLSADTLAELVGPIALYPDDLVGIVLPASTYPLQVVQAARFLDERAKNSRLEPNDDWDDSVVALLNYPEVVKLMNDDLDWTWRLGDAVINQRADVLDAIQGFRDRAYAAGNLRSDDRQVVVNDDEGAIAIKPADPEVIYVPYYEPERVVVYQRVPVFHYYPVAYPVYYYPYPVGYSFHTPFFWGVSSVFSIGWHTHFVHVHRHDYWGHPYYGRHYHDPFYVRRGANISVSRGSYVWEPHYRRGAQPFTRSDGRRYVGTRDERAAGAGAGGSYRSGNAAASRSEGQQRGRPADGNATTNRNRTTAGTSPRTEAGAGTYRSNSPGSQRAGRTGSDATQSGDATSPPRMNQSGRSRAVNPPTPGQYRSAPRANEGARTEVPPSSRSPGEYRSGRVPQQSAVPQRSRETAAPAMRVAPPAAAAPHASEDTRTNVPPSSRSPGEYRSGRVPQQSAAPPRTFGGVQRGTEYRGSERAASPRAEVATPRATPSPGESRSAPSSRGDGGDARAYRSQNPNQSVRRGGATER
jgi:hypothetical protein